MGDTPSAKSPLQRLDEQNEQAGGTPIDVLREYERLKLEVAAILRVLLHSAEKIEEASVQDCRRVLARLAEDRFNLAVVGQFSRGKSSLMNALLGMEKLPTGILPLTSVTTTVTYGEAERILLQREGWTIPQQIRLDELREYVTQEHNPGNEKKVLLAEIQLPHELLRLGVHFVDTPGVASSVAANTRTTRQFLPEADAAIFVTSFESPMTEAEVAFLGEVRAQVHKVFIVINKLDLVQNAQRAVVLEAVRETARKVLSIADPPIFAVSARQALAAKIAGSASEVSSSGLPDLEAALSEFLKKDKARESLLGVVGRSIRIAQRQQTSIRIAQQARMPEEKARLEYRLTALSAQLDEQRNSTIDRMCNQLPAEFAEACSQIAPIWSTETEAQIATQIQSWIARSSGGISGRLDEFLQSTLAAQLGEWMTKNMREIDEKFREITVRESPALESLFMAIDELPVAIQDNRLKSDLKPEISPPSSIEKPQLRFPPLDVCLANYDVPWWYDLMPKHFLWLFAGQWKRQASELKGPYERAIADLLRTAMSDWIDGVSREVSSRLNRTAKRTRELFTRELQIIEFTQVDELITRLERFMKSVLRMGADAFEPSSFAPTTYRPEANRSPVLDPCRICLAVEKALWDYWSHRQYELATNEQEQRNHALRSGFCPVHTWQYEEVASPQGVCAGYSELLLLYAKRLQLLAEQAASVEAMATGLKGMLPTRASCAACQLVAAVENLTARDIAKSIRGDLPGRPMVCAAHLLTVLTVATEKNAARQLIQAEARAFQELAENMQNHVLKHEAIRRDLSTRAESVAAIAGIERVAGRRRTV